MSDPARMSMHERVLAVLQGRKPDRIPFVDRLSIWHHARSFRGDLPPDYIGLSLPAVHEKVGMGQFLFSYPYDLRLRDVELVCRFNGLTFLHQMDPELTGFPGHLSLSLPPADQQGVTEAIFTTRLGKLRLSWEVTPDMVGTGVLPYMREHILKEESDFPRIEFILERAEIVPHFERVSTAEQSLGAGGFVVPHIYRIPFQAVLLEYMGEMSLFTGLYDMPARIERLLDLLDRLQLQVIDTLAGLDAPYVEYVDNLDGVMTNPRLFKKYCLPAYQRYVELLHAQGKKVGSHTDGDLKNLLHLLPETGLDVYESFSPAPLTSCPFDAAWEAWRGTGIIWGGIPSPILEASVPENQFRTYLDQVLAMAAGQPILLGIGDQVMGESLIERVQYIAERIEALPL